MATGPTGPTVARKRAAVRFGRWAEQLAAFLLRLKGYRILARDVRLPVGEIDLVARRGRTLAFVEVKARAAGAVPEVLTPRQQRRIVRAAAAFAGRDPRCAGCDIRFDVILLGRRPWPRHIVDAFRADDPGRLR
jgi:putative endonuclease